MKKRLLILMLALVLALCAFVSCGDEEEPDTGDSTTTSSSSNGTTASSKPAESKEPVISGGKDDCTHTWVSESKTESTCKDEGVENFKCSKCSATKQQTLALSKSHDYKVTETKEPTCQEAGSITKQCTICEKVETTPNGSKVSHKPEEVVVSPATCDKDGVKKNVCSMCGTDYRVTGFDSVIPKTGHSYENAENILLAEGVNFVAGNCESEGYFEVVCVTCGGKGQNITRDAYAGMASNPAYDDAKYDKMKKLGHNYAELIKQVDATCDVDGYTEYGCTRCDSVEKINPTKAPGHTYKRDASAVEGTHYQVITNATCLTAGKKAFICTVCQALATDDKGTETIPMLQHDTSIHTDEYLVDNVAATCSVKAYKVYKCCITASCTFTETVYEGELRQHKFVKNGEPSCLTEGKTPAKCEYTDCGFEAMHPDIPAVEIKHTLGLTISPATCVTDAKYKCANCDVESYGPYANDELYVDGFAHGRHQFETSEVVDPTCSSVGYIVYLCTGDPACDVERKNPNMDEPDVSNPEDITPRTSHVFDADGNGFIDITPDGKIVCDVCGQQYRDVTTQISKGDGKLCLGCDSDSIANCTCGLEVQWNGYVSPSIPEEHYLATGTKVTISSVTWGDISVEDGGGVHKLALGNGIIRIKGEAEDAEYTIEIYDSEGATTPVNTITVKGREVYVDLYEYAQVGKVSITATTGATVFFYEVPSEN